MNFRFKAIAHAAVLLCFCFSSSAYADADPAEGTWKTEASDQGYLLVKVASCDNLICGTIFRAFNNKDQENSDYKHLGKMMISGMQAKGNGQYAKGTIWAPDKDKTYKSKMKLEGDKLLVSGCVAFFCRSQVWVRVD